MKILSQINQKEDSKFLHWADNVSATGNPLTTMARSIVRFLIISVREFKNNELSLRAGALTYTLLLSLVPVLAMSTAVVKGLGGGDQLREVAYSYIETLEKHNPTPVVQPADVPQPENGELTAGGEQEQQQPDSSLTSHLRSALDTLFTYVDNTNFAALGSFGIAGVLFSVILVFGNIEKALNRIWHVENGRSILRKVADYITIMVLMPISINVAFAASAFLKNETLSSKFEILIPFAWLQALILQLVPILFIALTFFVIFIFFPNTKVKNRPALFGAIFAAVLWFGVQNIYISMQVGVAKYNAIYGSFATLPLFLVWIYLSLLFILGGAQIAYTIQNLSSFRLLPTTSIPSIRLSAAFDILAEVQHAFKEQAPITKEMLAERLHDYDSTVVEDIADGLCNAELLYCVGDDNRMLPSRPSERLEKRAVIDLILGIEIPETDGGITSREILDAAVEQQTAESEDSPGKEE